MQPREIMIALVAILGALVLLPFLVMGGMMGPGMMGWRMGPQGWGGGFGAFLWLLIIGGFALIVAAVIRRGARPEDPATLLKLRLARGEITREQFEELKQALQ